MPTMSNSQAPPLFDGQMGDFNGTRSPIFHLNRVASVRPMIAPVRVLSHACFWSSGNATSGFIARYDSGSAGKGDQKQAWLDRKSTRLNSSHLVNSYTVFFFKKKKK